MTTVTVGHVFEAPESEERELVLHWRCEQFGRLGFDPVDARFLAESPADLGQARRLRNGGCPIDLAFRILV